MTNDAAALYDGERIDEVNEKIRLIQKKNSLTFGTDAYMLAAFVKPQPRARAAELGSGSGIVSLLCAAKDKLSFIYAVEIQPELAHTGERNIALNGFENKIKQLNADVRTISSQDTLGELDVVFSNPPYMRAGHGKSCAHSIKNIARQDVLGGIDDFSAAAARLLKFGGKFYTVWRPDRLADLIDSLRRHKLEPKRMTFVQPDALTPPAIVLTEARYGGAPSLKLTAPLILYRNGAEVSPRVLTGAAEEIYRSCLL